MSSRLAYKCREEKNEILEQKIGISMKKKGVKNTLFVTEN